MRGYLKAVLVMLSLVFSFGCQGEESSAPAAAPAPPAVTVTTLDPGDLVVTREYAGFVEGRQFVQVRAQVDGLLLSKNYQEGQWVEKGQLLFQIDDSRYRALVDQAEARLRGARSNLDYAAKDLDRARKLMERSTISQRDLNTYETEFAGAQAAVNEAEASLAEARVRWEMTSVRAPVDGYAGLAEQMEGSLISASSESGGLLTNIYDMSSVRVVFSVPETQVRQIRRLMAEHAGEMPQSLEATLLVDADEVYPHQGRMDYGNASVDRASGTMQARAAFPNPDRELFNGQIVRVRLDLLKLPRVLSVPQVAVMQSQKGPSLALVDGEGQVFFQEVKIAGPVNSRFIVKPEGAVQAGAQVIVEGLNKVRPGSRVNPLESARIEAEQP